MQLLKGKTREALSITIAVPEAKRLKEIRKLAEHSIHPSLRVFEN